MEITEEQVVSPDEYYEIEAVSQSALKEIAKGPKAYLRALEPSQSTDYFKFGSAVDVMLTDPDEFENKFVVSEITMPSDTIKEIVEIIYKNAGNDIEGGLDNPEFQAFILGSAQTVGYGSKWKPDTVINKVLEGGSDYYDFLSESRGKQILSMDEYDRVTKCVQNLITDSYTMDYFKAPGRTGDKEYLYQVPIVWQYVYSDLTPISCKSLLDIVVIDHEAKTIKGVDLKTTGGQLSYFTSSFLKFRYDFQAGFYTLALNYYIHESRTELEDYKILPFEFLVVETNGYTLPKRFVCTEDIIVNAMEGFTTKSGYEYMGIKQAFDDLRWYQERAWEDEHDRKYLLADGRELLNLNVE